MILLVIFAFLPRAHGAIQPGPRCHRTLARVERRGRNLDRACRKAAAAGNARDRSIADIKSVLRGPRHVGVVGALLQARLDLRHGSIVEGADEILARCAVAA